MIRLIYKHLIIDLFYKAQLALIDVGFKEGRNALIDCNTSIEEFLLLMDKNYLLFINTITTASEMKQQYKMIKLLYKDLKKCRKRVLRKV